jgi:hypothetical protein
MRAKPNKPFEADCRKRALPACSAAQWRRLGA